MCPKCVLITPIASKTCSTVKLKAFWFLHYILTIFGQECLSHNFLVNIVTFVSTALCRQHDAMYCQCCKNTFNINTSLCGICAVVGHKVYVIIHNIVSFDHYNFYGAAKCRSGFLWCREMPQTCRNSLFLLLKQLFCNFTLCGIFAVMRHTLFTNSILHIL